MNDNPMGSGTVIERRRFIEMFSLLATSQLAGCDESDDGDNGNSKADRPSTRGRPSGISRQVETEIEELETVFEALADLPIQRSGTFVFNVKDFENEFDHRALVKTCNSITANLRSIEIQEYEGSSISILVTVSEIAKCLVQQRIVLHQIIAAGLEFRKEFYRTNFQNGAEVMTDAREYVYQLKTLGVDIEEKLDEIDGGSPSIDEFDRDAIETNQRMLLDITLWTDSAYEGLQYAAKGIETFGEGNSALEDERYGEAGRIYNDSNDYFVRAREAFESAQNKGTRLPYLAPFVDKVRCILPAYLDSTTGLSESMGYLNEGKEMRGKEIVREAFAQADRVEARCK